MRLHTSISILVIILMGTGCTGRRGMEQTPPPSWVEERPVSSLHYIGIGSATPNPIPGEALRTAKERAAADLVGEIALRVESTSLLESEERNGQVREDFTNTISSRAEERIAGFQVVDVWDGPQGTYVYYRLDKARYAAERQARREEAIDLALLEHEAGQEDLANGNIQGALDHWGAGVLGLEEFWNEVNRATIDGVEVSVEPHLLRAMREAVRNIDLNASMDVVSLSAKGDFRFPLGLHATLDGGNVRGLPLLYRYHNGTYMKKATEFTDDEGTVVALISDVDPARPDRNLTCTIDVDRLTRAAGLSSVLVELLGDLVVDVLTLPVEVEMPSVHIMPAANSQLDVEAHAGPIAALRSLLLDAGYIVVDAGADSDFSLAVDLRAERRTPSGDLGNFHTAYVQGGLVLRNASGNIIHQAVLDRVKGVQLDPATALTLALSNAAEALREKHGNDLIRALR